MKPKYPAGEYCVAFERIEKRDKPGHRTMSMHVGKLAHVDDVKGWATVVTPDGLVVVVRFEDVTLKDETPAEKAMWERITNPQRTVPINEDAMWAIADVFVDLSAKEDWAAIDAHLAALSEINVGNVALAMGWVSCTGDIADKLNNRDALNARIETWTTLRIKETTQ